eukprot:TRINITY_DN1633_c0_g1_i1.p1 TRINITY_DN1633_c0_g1~~TRINITY_DN1633_c0_g1_i1.p1  ORF type:complete len:349 (+),score=83.07 TRINITY_DN1633_c0_g1_i1:47-1093(+)
MDNDIYDSHEEHQYWKGINLLDTLFSLKKNQHTSLEKRRVLFVYEKLLETFKHFDITVLPSHIFLPDEIEKIKNCHYIQCEWMPVTTFSRCNSCMKQTGLKNCWLCGQLVCNSCEIPHLIFGASAKLRSCQKCFDILKCFRSNNVLFNDFDQICQEMTFVANLLTETFQTLIKILDETSIKLALKPPHEHSSKAFSNFFQWSLPRTLSKELEISSNMKQTLSQEITQLFSISLEINESSSNFENLLKVLSLHETLVVQSSPKHINYLPKFIILVESLKRDLTDVEGELVNTSRLINCLQPDQSSNFEMNIIKSLVKYLKNQQTKLWYFFLKQIACSDNLYDYLVKCSE